MTCTRGGKGKYDFLLYLRVLKPKKQRAGHDQLAFKNVRAKEGRAS